MRIAYLDCFAGISGDMFLGALLDAGVPPQVLTEAVAALKLGITLQLETVDRSGISCTKVHVLEQGHPAEPAQHQHPHEHGHKHDHDDAEGREHAHVPGHKHDHNHEHDHNHDHRHKHGRSLSQIRELLQQSPLPQPVRARALHTFELLGNAEAKIHNIPVDQIHFHEVGAVDAIADIVAASAGVEYLHSAHPQTANRVPLQWHASPINVGGGTVLCAHGTFPVPAPATADLLRHMPTYSAHIEKELVTPTGAALLRALAPKFGPQPLMQVESIGYGAGSRNPKGFPNALRISIGEAVAIGQVPAPAPHQPQDHTHTHDHNHDPAHDHTHAPHPKHHAPDHNPHAHEHSNKHSDHHDHHDHRDHAQAHLEPHETPRTQRHEHATVTVLETALDDTTPQVLAYVAERALALGALDAMLLPVIMKKGRPGTLVTLLCNEADAPSLESLLLRETSTLGVRRHQQQRSCLDRVLLPVETIYGPIRIKVGTRLSEGSAEALNIAPEFDDCRTAALQHNVPLKLVMQAALSAYASSDQKTARQPEPDSDHALQM